MTIILFTRFLKTAIEFSSLFFRKMLAESDGEEVMGGTVIDRFREQPGKKSI